MALKLITPPSLEPVDAAYCRKHLRLDDAGMDDLISSYISAVRQTAEGFQNRAMLTQTWELSLDEFPSSWVKLPRPPLQSLVSVTLYPEGESPVSLDLNSFQLDTVSEPGRVTLQSGYTWPNVQLREANGLVIRYVVGYSSATSIQPNEKTAIALGVVSCFQDPSAEMPPLFYRMLESRRIIPWAS